jgi:hypothetical protein
MPSGSGVQGAGVAVGSAVPTTLVTSTRFSLDVGVGKTAVVVKVTGRVTEIGSVGGVQAARINKINKQAINQRFVFIGSRSNAVGETAVSPQVLSFYCGKKTGVCLYA